MLNGIFFFSDDDKRSVIVIEGVFQEILTSLP